MKVRIRLRTGHPVRPGGGKNRQLALSGGALLVPAALMAYVLGTWSLASQLGISGAFGITGLFSHWQVWIALAVALHVSSSVLTRYGRGGELNVPRVLNPRILPFKRPEPPQ